MIDETTALGARIVQRLRDERVIWLTSVDRGGPRPAPVWFLYERDSAGERILVYSMTTARRNAAVAADPKVALNFNCTPGGDQVHVIRGVARLATGTPPASENAAYLARYRDLIVGDESWGGTPEGFAAQYSVPLEITDLTAWGW